MEGVGTDAAVARLGPDLDSHNVGGGGEVEDVLEVVQASAEVGVSVNSNADGGGGGEAGG